MGKILSCCCKERTENDEVNERSRLLADPVSNNFSGQMGPNGDYIPQYPSQFPITSGDQSDVFNKILHETATNVIDVTSMGVNHLQRRHYSPNDAYKQLKINTQQIVHLDTCLLQSVSDPEKVILKPVNPADIIYIKKTAEKISEAMSQFKVEHRQNLVVAFPSFDTRDDEEDMKIKDKIVF